MFSLFHSIWIDVEEHYEKIVTYASDDVVHLAQDDFIKIERGAGVRKQWASYDDKKEFAGGVCYTIGRLCDDLWFRGGSDG